MFEELDENEILFLSRYIDRKYSNNRFLLFLDALIFFASLVIVGLMCYLIWHSSGIQQITLVLIFLEFIVVLAISEEEFLQYLYAKIKH